MYYFATTFREIQTLPEMWNTAGTGIPINETWLDETGLTPNFGQLTLSG